MPDYEYAMTGETFLTNWAEGKVPLGAPRPPDGLGWRLVHTYMYLLSGGSGLNCVWTWEREKVVPKSEVSP